MDKGLIPPATGSKLNNENWYQIDPQLVNEIWSIFYPGMIQKSVDRADWPAHITSDDIVNWHRQNEDWRMCRKLIFIKFTGTIVGK